MVTTCSVGQPQLSEQLLLVPFGYFAYNRVMEMPEAKKMGIKNKAFIKIALIAVVCLGIGFFAGMEYKAYQVRSALKPLADVFGDGEPAKTTKQTKQEESIAERLKKKVDIQIVGKDFQQSSWEDGIYDSFVIMDIRFENKTNKGIKGVQGRVVFSDIFDNRISETRISYDEGIPANESKTWQAGIDYNEFSDTDEKLRATDLEDLRYKWVPDTIIYEDGTTETE